LDSFGRRRPGGLARRRPLLGEPREARVQEGSDDGANDRGCQVQPGIVEIAGRDHWAKRPRRVEGVCVPKTLNPTIVVMKSAQDGCVYRKPYSS
jgi:hypothetical protein